MWYVKENNACQSLHNIFLYHDVQLLGVDSCVLREALTHKKITAKGEEVWYLLITTNSTIMLSNWNVALDNES